MTDQVSINYLHAFLERHPTRSFNKGEILIFQGEVPRSTYVIKNGIVKAYNLSVNGDEKPVGFYKPDTAFPTSWTYHNASSSIYFYEAFTEEVEVYVLDRDEYTKFIKNRPALLYQEFERLLSDHLAASVRLNALQHSKASDKLMYTLHYLAISHGQKQTNGKIIIELDLKHQDFANLTGLTRETAATELNRLKRDGVIDYTKGSLYTLDLNKLQTKLNDQYIADLSPKP